MTQYLEPLPEKGLGWRRTGSWGDPRDKTPTDPRTTWWADDGFGHVYTSQGTGRSRFDEMHKARWGWYPGPLSYFVIALCKPLGYYSQPARTALIPGSVWVVVPVLMAAMLAAAYVLGAFIL